MVDLVHELSDTHGRRISLVGWSLGGLYARQLAKMMPDRVRSVITLGSPFAGNPKATNAWRVYETASGRRADEEDGRFGGSLAGTPPVPTTAIFSRTDGICAWQGCMEKPSARSENIEVESSHCGMAIIPLWSTPWPIVSRSQKASGRRSTAAAGAAWSIPIPPGRRRAPTGGVRSVVVNPENALCVAHAASACPHHRPAQARTLAHRFHRHHGVRRCNRARGGSVWLGTLLEFFKTLDIDSGVVRTAMSRLATDGWLERNKVGRTVSTVW